MKRLTQILQLFITLALLAVGAVFMSSMLPIPGGIESKIVQSGSMEPAIPVGALVFIMPAAHYQVGDVITFNDGKRVPTTHRIVAQGEAGYTTKGDANEEPDSQVVAAQKVVGKVWLTVPYAGFVLHFARQPLGFALLIGLPALMVIVDESVALWQALRGARQPKPQRVVRYARLRTMDDMFVVGTVQRRTQKHAGSLGAAVSLMLVVVFGLTYAGHTLALFADQEYTSGNLLAATTWAPIPVVPFVNPFSIESFAQPALDDTATTTATTTETHDQSGEVLGEQASTTPPAIQEEPPVVEPEPLQVEEPQQESLQEPKTDAPQEPEAPQEQATPQEGEVTQD